MPRRRAQVLAFPATGAHPRQDDAQQASHAQHLTLNAEDGTLHLLRSGFLLAGAAALAMLLVLHTFGGIGADGPRTSLGWLALMVALMSLPFGLLLLLLGGAKWLRNCWLSRAVAFDADRAPQRALPYAPTPPPKGLPQRRPAR